MGKAAALPEFLWNVSSLFNQLYQTQRLCQDSCKTAPSPYALHVFSAEKGQSKVCDQTGAPYCCP